MTADDPRTAASRAGEPRTGTDLLVAHARLARSRDLLDPRRLGELLGREVRIDRIRIKPGSSVLVSYRDAATPARPGAAQHGSDLAQVGWVQLVDSADKREGILRRAARGGIEVTEHQDQHGEASEQGPFLLSGGVDSDPRLGKLVHSVLRRLTAGPVPRVLSYNPSRHLVLELPGTGEVLRVAARPLADLHRVSELWLALGLPTTAQHPWRGKDSVLVSELWGSGDLAALAGADHAGTEHDGTDRREGAHAAARTLGEVIARLHDADVSEQDPTGRELPVARTGELVPVSTEILADLMPHRAEQVQELCERLGGILHELTGPGAEQALIHGDLSPDQVLVGREDSGRQDSGGQDIRVVDLDRSGLGHPGIDLGTYLAACRTAGADHLAEGFLAGYAVHRALPGPAELAAWTARALLAAALDPMRRFHEDWPAQLAARLDLARTVLDAGTDTALAALPRVLAAHPAGQVLAHRPGKRAVVRVRRTDGPGHAYIKVAGRFRTARLLAAIDRASAFDGPFRTPPVLAADAESVTFGEVTGTPLHDGLPTEDGTWQRAWQAATDAWAEAVQASRAGGIGRTWTEHDPATHDATVHGPAPHGHAEEIAVLLTWRERAASADPAGAPGREAAVTWACRLLEQLPPIAQPALIHRDLHDKQILWQEGEKPGLLDVDTATVGDPALDAGNLRAHATWRERQGVWTPEQAAVVREQIDRAAAAVGIDQQRLDAYERATLARLTCVYALRPAWRALAMDVAAELADELPVHP